MPPEATTLDLSTMALKLGEKSSSEIELYLPPLKLAGQEYSFSPETVKARLEVVFAGEGYHVTIAFSCRLAGPCWRCLEPAGIGIDVRVVDYFELELPPEEELDEEDEPSLWYTHDGVLNLSDWAHDAAAGMLPMKILCDEDCRGLCAQCGINLNQGECGCQPPTDSRWEKLKDWQPEG